VPRPSGMKRLLQAALAASFLLPGGFAAAREGSFHTEMSRLAEERGCTFCHREAPAAEADGALPLAPSWRDIATRYRGRVGAVADLAAIVEQGADPAKRHWANRLDFAAMRGNAPQVSPAEARALSRWILSYR
jgi:cytochrome c551/c552